MLSRCSVRKALKLAPVLHKPYNALTMINSFPSSFLNLGPAQMYNFSAHGAVRYAFCISAQLIYSSFSAALSNPIRTESLDTTVLYVTDDGVAVQCPSPTHLALQRKCHQV